MAERDPLTALARAWRSAEPPPPPDALERTDGATRASVAWLQQAWSRAAVPAAVPPRRSGRRPAFLRPPPAARVLPLAAAACWALALIAVGARLAELVSAPGDVLEPSPRNGGADTRVASITADRVELRHGSVRLVLLTGEAHASDGGTRRDPPAQQER